MMVALLNELPWELKRKMRAILCCIASEVKLSLMRTLHGCECITLYAQKNKKLFTDD